MILNNLKKFFFKRKKYNTKNIKDILNNIIKISYSSSFNKKFKIPKTFYSRYEIILILIFLIYIRLKNEKVNKMKVQIMYNYLFDYIDYSLREIGTGDLSVGKKVKTMARIFSFRIQLYEKSISKDFKNIYGKSGNFQQFFNVYGQENINCSRISCKGKIKKILISNRSSFYCNICQN